MSEPNGWGEEAGQPDAHDDEPRGEAAPDAASGSQEQAPTAPEPAPATGHPAVDEVLRSLERLDGLPVGEHVAVFEKAHDDLRRALSEARDREA